MNFKFTETSYAIFKIANHLISQLSFGKAVVLYKRNSEIQLMQKFIHSITVLIIFSILTSCGSAEPVEFYQYTTSKSNLENAVNTFLLTNKNQNLIWDTSSSLFINRYNPAYKNKPSLCLSFI